MADLDAYADAAGGNLDELSSLLAEFEPLPTDFPLDNDVATTKTDSTCSDTETTATASVASLEFQDAQAEEADGDDATSRRECARKRRARYRDRSRNELLYLRELVAELEHDLQRWKRRLASGYTVGDASARGLAMAPSTQAKVWRALAFRQRVERQQSEAENARLRVLLENQLRFAAQVKSLTRGRDAIGVPRGPAMERVPIDAADASVFDAYLSEMDAIYAQTDAVMRETGLMFEPEEQHRTFTLRSPEFVGEAATESSSSYVEMLDTLVLPSPLAIARENTWQTAIQQYLQRSGAVYDPAHLPLGASTVKYRYRYKWCGRDSFVTVSHALRIYDEPDRQVVVYRVLTVGEGGLAGTAMDEVGWSVQSTSPTLGDDRTLFRSVTKLRPMRLPALAQIKYVSQPPSLMEFAKITFNVGDIDFAEMRRHLERLSLSGRDSTPRRSL